MSKTSLKRTFDIYSSPASSTPPRPAAARAYAMTPSDSPTNPFGLYRVHTPQALPRPTPPSEHLVLRFTLAAPGRNGSVHRIASVPANYTFWHLDRLVRFLFGWRARPADEDACETTGGSGTSEKGSMRGKERAKECEHFFEVQKDVALFAASHRAGLVKGGRTWAVLAGKHSVLSEHPECTREREESFTLRNAWPRGADVTRAITYVHDRHGRHPQTVYITVSASAQKEPSGRRMRASSNVPYVLRGAGLPDDDDDDDDFALDLDQWNDAHAFEDFIEREDNGSGGGVAHDDDEDELSQEERMLRIEEAHERMKQMASDGLSQFDSDNEDDRKKKRTRVTKKTNVKPKPKVKKEEDEGGKKKMKDKDYDPLGDEAEL